MSKQAQGAFAPIAPIQVLQNPFLFSSHEVRTAIGQDAEAWFCAKDVCESVEIEWKGSVNTLRHMPEEWQALLKLSTPGGDQDAIFLSEAGVYRLIFRSNKPRAIEFTNWVCLEVLPAIRKNGFYGQLSFAEVDKNVRRITDLCEQIPDTKKPFASLQKLAELRYRCNLIGWKMPDLALLEDGQADMWKEGA